MRLLTLETDRIMNEKEGVDMDITIFEVSAENPKSLMHLNCRD